MTAKESGSVVFTEKLTTAHEQDRPSQPLGEKLMDLNNNQVGRDVWVNSIFASKQSLYEAIIEEAAAGKLQTYEPKTGIRSNFKLTKTEIKKLKEIKIDNYEN